MSVSIGTAVGVSPRWAEPRPLSLPHRHGRLSASIRRRRLFAEPDPEIDPRTFDEGAAQVKRLMRRDRSQYAGPDFEALLNKQFASDTAKDVIVDKDLEEPVKTAGPKPVSPFGTPSSSKAVNPFGQSPASEPKIFAAELESREDAEPWWTFVKSITLTQIVLACSFLLIIASMLGTFAFVLKSGAIHFNE